MHEDSASPTTRVRIDLAYDGTDFSGWAAQPGRRTVEGALVESLERVLRRPGLRVVVAGRTDAGVHARGQVCHVDLPADAWGDLTDRAGRPPTRVLVTRLNGVLPADVVVRSAVPAPSGFDARFSALSRRYRYLVCDAPHDLDPLRRREVVVVRDRLDVQAMDAAAQHLLGLRDFAAFCKRREGASTIRTLLRYRWARRPDGLVEAEVVADAFCHSMVRALVGAVVPVGMGREGAAWPQSVADAGTRDPRVKVMPAHGLSLEEVTYPEEAELTARATQARARREPSELGASAELLDE